ncbi:DUF3169 family protein [Staphylococcus arlettae]|uniref:DUF3169 family protein n=1 Tax=Staphylococcus arlettae TaxID=29378 RepID=UPI0002823003|nr:DUF3169 family protein [Staphylococcus arlettae]EJY95737.1 hypothetical protein SARL_06134 [Staphylococcus arlettae CVD059]MCD9054070.1 DUF3169 family protein [Staphylococcus arlettae]MDT3894646.1 DUF3169 family protein [Staphylococcus arlettae]MDT4050176.1 DUF3169 family protein [Staphylococcus arlettae]UXU50065.1 DUF3169 family protein [Staphylococcus arlettae]
MKVGRYLLLILLGAIVGGVIGAFFGMFEDRNLFSIIQFSNSSIEITIITLASVINIVLTFVLYRVQRKALQYKKQMNKEIADHSADDLEQKANLNFLRTSFIYYTQVLVSLLTLFFIVLGNGTNQLIIFVLLPYIITIIPSIMIGFFVRKYDARYPKQGEAKYTEKVLNLMDDGERHITLVSMYKIYNINMAIIIIGGMLLGLFSLISGINQILGLVILIVLFIYNGFGYLFKVRKFYY